jgi:hypothetical protein
VDSVQGNNAGREQPVMKTGRCAGPPKDTGIFKALKVTYNVSIATELAGAAKQAGRIC